MKSTTEKVTIAPEAKAAFLEMLRPTGTWVYVEYDKTHEGGCVLRVKKYRCNICGNERNKRQGPSQFCEVCGARMLNSQEGGNI